MSNIEEHYSEPVYSNYDHSMDEIVIAVLEANPGGVAAQHAAWNFCGWIWKGEDGLWHEEVWVYGELVETTSNEDLMELISSVNSHYGTR